MDVKWKCVVKESAAVIVDGIHVQMLSCLAHQKHLQFDSSASPVNRLLFFFWKLMRAWRTLWWIAACCVEVEDMVVCWLGNLLDFNINYNIGLTDDQSSTVTKSQAVVFRQLRVSKCLYSAVPRISFDSSQRVCLHRLWSCCVSSRFPRSGALRSSYARLLFLLVARAQCSNSAQSRLCRTGSRV